MPSTTPPQMPPPTPPYRHLHHPPKPMKHQPFSHFEPGPGYEPAHRKQGLLRPHRRTNPLIWCGAIVCVIFSILLILAGIVTLIVFLVIKPRSPAFEITGASLNGIYLDTPTYFNGDLTFLANFSNPNTKLDLVFEYLSIELYYHDRLVSAQGLGPFMLQRQQSRLESVHMISSEVYLPMELAVQIQKEMRSNKVMYSVRGTFKVRAIFGLARVSYWIYGRCLIQLTAPPGGVLVGRSCRTKK